MKFFAISFYSKQFSLKYFQYKLMWYEARFFVDDLPEQIIHFEDKCENMQKKLKKRLRGHIPVRPYIRYT